MIKSINVIQYIFNHYKTKFPIQNFYDNLLCKIKNDHKNPYIKSEKFLKGYKSFIIKDDCIEPILAEYGDIRADLPVWFGNPDSVHKIVILGLEPRNTNAIFNIERVGKYVFATPFALERPKGPYYKAFFEAINKRDDLFVYFSDVVKTFLVTGNKEHDDRVARKNFSKNAERDKAFLQKELEIIQPLKIIALGNDSFSFLKKHLENSRFTIEKIRHPSRGGAKIANEQFQRILQEMLLKSSLVQ